MAAAYTNSLQALNGIYGALDIIIKKISISDTTQGRQEKAQNDVKNLNRGGLNGIQNPGRSSETTNVIAPNSVKDMASALLSLPPAVRAVAGLGTRQINSVVNTLEKLGNAFSSLATNSDTVKGTASLKFLAEGLVQLQEIKFVSLILTVNALDRANIGEKIGRVFKNIMTSYKSLGEFTKDDMDNFKTFSEGTNQLSTTAKRFALMLPLMPMFIASTALFSPGIRILGRAISRMPDADKVKSAIAAAEILNTFTKSATVIILSSILLAASFKVVGKSEILLAIGVTTTVITLLGGLAVAVAKVAGKSKNSVEQLKTVNDFINSLAFTTGLIYGVSMFYVLGSSIINAGLLAVSLTILSLSALAVLVGAAGRLMHARRTLRRITNFVRSIVLMTGIVMGLAVFAAVAKEPIMAGLGIVTGIILGLTVISMLVGALSLITHRRGMVSVLGIAAFSLALVLGTMLIGAIIAIPGAAELLLFGLGTVTAVLLAYTLIATIAGVLGIVVETLAPALLGVIKIAGFSLALILGTMLVGSLVIQGWPLLVAGLGGVLGTLLSFEGIMLLTGVVAGKAKILEMSGAWKDLLLFAGGALLLTLGVVAIGALIHRVGPVWIAASLATTAGVLVGLKLIAEEAIKLGTGPTLPAGIAALKQVGIFAAEVLAITAGVVLVAKLMEGIDNKWLIAASFGLMSAVMWEAFGLAKAATINRPTIDQGIIDFKSTILLLGSAELLAFGLVGLAKVLEDTSLAYIGAAFLLVTSIAAGAYGLAVLISKNKPTIDKGVLDIKSTALLLGTAELLAFGIVGLAKSLEYVSTSKIIGAFALVTLIVGEAYGLALLATKHKRTMRQGAKDIRDALLLMAGAELVAGGVILLARALENTPAEKVLGAIGLMTAIIIEAGVLAAAASKISGSIKSGAIAILVAEGLMLGGALVLRAVIEIAKIGQGYWKDTLYAIGEMTLMIGLIGGLAFAAGALITGPQALLFAAGSAALLACEGLTMNGAKMLGSVIEVTKQAENVDFDKIKETFGQMKAVIGLEVGLMLAASRSVRALLLGAPALKRINNVIDSTCETISKFIMLSTYMEKAGMDPATLPDQLNKVLSAISPNIFVHLFDDGFLKTAVKIQAGYKSYSKIIDIVKNALDMYANFVNVTKGRKIDNEALLETSTAIANSLSAFMSALEGKTFDINKKTVKKLNKALGELIEPVSNFAELITKYSGDGNNLAIITYDQNGVAHIGQSVDVIKTANILINAVMTFCTALYNEDNKKIWKEISGTTKGEEGSLEKGIGIFAAIIDPVAKFAEVLTKFEDGGEGILTIPEYDENGKLKANSRKVNIVNVSRMLANAVTTFIEELYVKHMDQWTAVLSSLNMIDPSLAEGEEKAGNKAGLSEAIGVFGEILNPILNFASVLLKFGTDKQNQLTVIDENGKPHAVNVEVIASGIASAVTLFIEKIAGIFDDRTMESISKMNDNSVAILNVLNGFVENISNAAQIDQKNLKASTELIPGFVKAFNDSILALNNTITEDDIKVFEDSFTKLNTALNSFLVDTFNEESLKKFKDSTLELKDNANILITGVLIPDDIAAFETTATDFISFLSSAYTELLSTITPDDERYATFLNTNTELAKAIRDSLTSLFSTLAVGEDLNTFINNSKEYKVAIDDALSEFLTDFIKQESLDSFTNSIDLFKEVLNSSINKVFGNASFAVISNKIWTFTTAVKASIAGMLKNMIQPDDIAAFTSSMDSMSVSIHNILGESIPDDSARRFEHIMNTIKGSTEILANEKTITDTDTFNKNLDTLMNNISSASETSKVKKINSLGNAVKTTTGEMTKFDNTLKNGSKSRIKELNELGKAVGNVSAKVKGAQEGLNELRNVLNAIERADPNKITSLTDAISASTSRAVANSGGGTTTLTIDYEYMAKQIAKAIAGVFDNAIISPSQIQQVEVEGNRTEKHPIPSYKFDIEDSTYNY